MPFNLHIEIAGICLFVRRSRDGKLHVLLPPVAGMEPHVKVIGWPAKYNPKAPTGKTHQELSLEAGTLDLSQLVEGGDSLVVDLPGVVDISDIVNMPADQTKALAHVVIGHGTLCPSPPCQHRKGARWRINSRPPTHMATSIQWRITGVTNEVEDDNGVRRPGLKIKTSNGGTLATLRPDSDGQIRIYVYNAPHDELPSQPEPTNPVLNPGDEAHHFRGYYALFGDKAGPLPQFEDEGRDASDPNSSFRAANSLPPAFTAPSLSSGRRFTCMLAVNEE
ncbi:MAG TPA: hypothetical protein VF746_30295 [Longimicrobium sp.]|jgi:hypothetical protein